jgi:hypothetical protein
VGGFITAPTNLASPSAIGSTTPNSGAFTTLSASTSLQISTSGYLFGGTNLIEQRNSTSGQTFRLYNTYTDASNYERGFMRWTSNVLEIGAEATGSGTNRVVRINAGVDNGIEFYLGTRVMSVKQAGGFSQIYYTSAAWSISAAVAAAGNTNFTAQPVQISAGRGTGSGTAGYITFFAAPSGTSGTALHPANEEAFRISVPATGASFVSFGGITSASPALKRSSATLQARLGDDSGYTTLDAQLRSQGTAPATAAATGTAGDIRYDGNYIYVCTATNTWKRVAIATW